MFVFKQKNIYLGCHILFMKNATLKDIANELNISITTVSKALKNYTDVSEKTKNSVLKLAEKLNYKPNSFAVNLRTKESKVIGLIVPDIVHHFFSKIVSAVVKEATKNGYMVITLQSYELFANEKKQIEMLLDKRVDGILISLSNETHSLDHLQKVIDSKIPLVVFDKISKLLNCSKVVINDREAAYNATTHLINLGYKKIAHFRGSLNPQNSIDRFLGYKKALLDHNLEFDNSLVYICPNNDDFNDGYNNAKKLLSNLKDVEAVFAVTDLIAIGALKCFHDNNIKVPEDIAIIGFSDWFMSSVTTPTLSTVHQPASKIGKQAFKLFLEELTAHKNGENYNFKTVVLPTKIVPRESTKISKN